MSSLTNSGTGPEGEGGEGGREGGREEREGGRGDSYCILLQDEMVAINLEEN